MLLDSRLLFAASYFLSTHLIFLEPEGRPKGGAEMGVERVTEATSEDDERENDATSDTTPTLPVLRHSVHSPYVSLTSCLRACKEGGVTKNEERGPDDKDERHEG